MADWADRFPFLNTKGREQLKRRFESCLPFVSQAFGWTEEQTKGLHPLGCGNYGCTYLIPGAPRDRAVVKVTTDNLEAHVVKLLTEWGEDKPDGIVKYNGIWQLGKCSVLPKMRGFEYTKWPVSDAYAYGLPTSKQKVYYRGPGAPYRPVWVLSREEAPDAWPVLQARGLKKRDFQSALELLQQWSRYRAYDWGAPGASRIQRFELTHKPPQLRDDAMEAAMAPIGGVELMNALDWLMEREIGFYDFTKIANLGWREGTGLVIRDIGFASTKQTTEADPSVLGRIDGIC